MNESEIEVKKAVLDILKNHNSLTLATTGGEFSPWILSVYFASEGLDIYFFLEESGKTIKNVAINKKVATAISQNDATKDFLQAYGQITILRKEDDEFVRNMLIAKIPWFQTYTPVFPVKLKIDKYFVSSFSRNWFPAKELKLV
jgi:uncharacterized protein YhbP (UPF0306 family)